MVTAVTGPGAITPDKEISTASEMKVKKGISFGLILPVYNCISLYIILSRKLSRVSGRLERA
jgi:hypothetical protein